MSLFHAVAAAVVCLVGGWSSAVDNAPPANTVQPDDRDVYARLTGDLSRSIVTVKFVLKVEGGQFTGADESETEVSGVMVDSSGIVLCSNFQVGGLYSIMARSGGPTATPSDVKVLVGDDTEGKKATVIARDTDLDLAWVRIDEPAHEYMHVDLAKAGDPALGERVFTIGHMDKLFDRAHVVREGKIAGVATKPRKLFMPSATLLTGRGDLGLPAFAADGRLVGIIVLQIPDAETMEEGGMADLGGGPMILPSDAVARATRHALETAPPRGEKPVEDEKP